MRKVLSLTFVLCLIFLSACQTTKPKTQKSDTISDSISALGTVTEGLTNQSVSPKDLKNVALQIQKDPKVKSAVQGVTQALRVQQTGVKYCPVDGERFDSSVEECPIHHVKLKVVE